MPELVRMHGVAKRYPGVVALQDVDFSLAEGEVRAVLGKNGAGKSTLINVLAGVVRPTEGSIEIAGQSVNFRRPADAIKAGIATVHQELSVVPELTVAENIFLGRWPLRGAAVDWRSMNALATRVLAQLGLHVDPQVAAKNLPVAQRQLVEIARALGQGARLLILDEPTSSLVAHEVEILIQAVRRLSSAGVGVIYISHRMDEIRRVAHSVTVMRDGRHVGTAKVSEISDAEIVRLMLGAEAARVRPSGGGKAANGANILVARDVTIHPRIQNVSFEVRTGEILGLAGVLGSGRTELLQALAGIRRLSAGTLVLDGKPYRPANLRAAKAAGIVMTPEDRRGEGAVVMLGIDENLVMANWGAISRFGVISRSAQTNNVSKWVSRLGIKLTRNDEALANLSGGNQQKVVIGKALNTNPRLLLLDEPTRGVDVGAKAQIYALMREFADNGLAVVFVSGELEEFPGVCDRVLVLRDGRVTGEFTGDGIETQQLLDRTMGENGGWQ
jgi:sugar transport system ATP-binding protein